MANNTTEPYHYAPVNSSECFVLQHRNFVPWNNSDNIISYETQQILKDVTDLIFLPLMFLIGVPANIINMLVFYKHGLKERVNVCLFALSLADGLYVFNVTVIEGERIYLFFTTKETYGPVLKFVVNNNLGGLYGLTWVSQVLSAIVASERCFCILRPLKYQTILRTSTMTAIIVVVFIVLTGFRCLVFFRYYIGCVYASPTDSTITTFIPREFYLRNKKMVDFIDSLMYGLGLPSLVIVVVMSATIVTVVKLRQVAEWRAGISSSSGSVSGRDVALTRMLVANSIFFLACLFPVALYRVSLIFVPEINAGGRFHNLFLTALYSTVSFSVINSTFNFVVYYTMGSRYRQTFWTLMGRKNTKYPPPPPPPLRPSKP